MKSWTWHRSRLSACLCGLLIAGCSGGGLDTEYVEGTVMLDGQPVPEATIMFVPVVEGEGVSAAGQTDNKGVYRLTAANTGGEVAKAGSGTRAGEYYVGVIKSIAEVPMSEEEAQAKGIPYVRPKPGQSSKMTHVVPVKYNNPKQSGIKVTVSEGKNDIPIELSSS